MKTRATQSFLLLNFIFYTVAAPVSQVAPTPRHHLRKSMPTLSDTEKLSQLLFTSLEKETSHTELPVKGTIPDWLKGTLVRNGPSLFEIADESFQHWFDGQPMLHGFTFDGTGKVSYENKLLDTANLRAHRKAGKIAAKEFCSAPSKNFVERVVGAFSSDGIPYETTNVNVAQAGGKYFAMTETPRWIEFEIPSVQTKGVLTFNDKLEHGQMCSAHPLTTPEGEHINFVTCFGKTHRYLIFRIPPSAPGHTKGHLERELIAEVPTEHAAYMHSFCVTEDYVILVECPWHFSLWRMLSNQVSGVFTGEENSLDSIFEWKPERGTTFTVVRRSDGSVQGKYKAPAFFSYHQANAFVDPADPDKLHVDLMCYERVFYDDMSLKSLRSNALDGQHPGALRRYTLDLGAAEAARSGGDAVCSAVLYDGEVEFPRINDRVLGKHYECIWGTGMPGSSVDAKVPYLIRVNAQTGESAMWAEDGCYPGEGVFVPGPGGGEDAGVLMSVVLDWRAEKSFLLILDGATMKEKARVEMPHHVPLGLHGFFFQ